MKKLKSMLLTLSLVFGLSASAFATEGTEFTDVKLAEKIAAGISSEDIPTIEPNSRWYTKEIKEIDDKPFTEYSADKKRMVSGKYDMVATYRYYRDGSGKRQHVKDTYYYTWTGYYRKHTTGTASNWIVHPDYVNVEEKVVDRGPANYLFGFLLDSMIN